MFRAVRLMLPVFCLVAMPVQAAVFTVTKTADTLDGACDRDCSLREAIAAANAQTGGATDVVVVPAGIYDLTRLGAGEDGNATGDLDVHDRLILVGAGAGSTVLSGWGFDRVLDLRARTEIHGVTISAGRVDGDGGGLLVRRGSHLDVVLLRRSVVSGNLAENGSGGGIAVEGFLEVSESAILENHAAGGDGGGIWAGENGFFSLTNATVSYNRAAGSGGGPSFPAGNAAISSSTIVINHAQEAGGGIFARPAPSSGAFPPELLGSIIAGNTAPESPDCEGARSAGYNVFGRPAEQCAMGPTDESGFVELPLPIVSALPRFGLGPTPVHTLLDGSPALGLVPAAHCPPADQLGQARTAPCDAGAWERPEDPVCIPGGTVLCLQNGRFRVTAFWGLDERLSRKPAPVYPLSDDTGNFWFFHPENLELMVKVLDGCAVNQRWWVFSSGLTDVGVTLRVEDLETGRTWENSHPVGSTYPPRLDTGAFPCAPAARSSVWEKDSPAGPAPPAAVLVVTKTADTDDGSCDHDCSLREAVLRANLWGEGVIVLRPGVYTLGIPGGNEDLGHTGDLDVIGDLVILGTGAARTVIDGGGLDRVLDVGVGGKLELHGVTVQGGWARPVVHPFFPGAGGGIRNLSSLVLVRSVVWSNLADHDGGGIASHGLVLAVRESTVSGNVAGSSGGGIAAELSDLENVTLSGNRAGFSGGGFLAYDDAALRNVTIAGNTANIGGGIALDQFCAVICPPPPIAVVLQRTVIAGNASLSGPGGDGPFADCVDLLPSSGEFNVFGIGDGCNPRGTDRFGTPAQPLDPRLTPLGDHGGPTPTHALLPDSPAVDIAPDASCPSADQRGRPRPADGDGDGSARCDAGAVERLPGCQPDEHTLCLGRLGETDRFRVTARWTTVQGATGPGKAVPLAAFNGSFWFFDASNLELTVKVLDGCGLNGRFWVFLSGLTDVGVEVTVEDTVTGNIWTHEHAAGTPLQPRLDTNALECANP